MMVQQPTPSERINTPLKMRFVYGLKAMAIKLTALCGHQLVKAMTLVDDFLAHNLLPLWRTTPKPDNVVREPLLSPLTPVNGEIQTGRSWPSGIPASELQLYTKPRLLVLSGGTTNRYGHALLAFGDPDALDTRYMQISSANWYPEHLDAEQFEQYLSKNQAQISYEIDIPCNNPNEMRKTLDKLSRKKWLWGGPFHNCMSMAKQLATAAGTPPELFSQFQTVDNSYPTQVVRGLETTIAEVVTAVVPEGRRTQVSAHLQEALTQAVNQTSHNPLDSAGYIEALIQALTSSLKSLDLEESTLNRLHEKLAHNGVNRSWQLIELASKNFLLNTFGHLMDIPLTDAHRMPGGLRKVGPQTHTRFFGDSDL